MGATKILTLIFLFSIVHLTKIYAQKEYVITKNNDTIFCKIKTDSYGEYSLAYKYRVNKNDDFVKIDSNITAYHLANDSAIYLLKTLPGQNQRGYAKWLVKGRINLYAYTLVYQFINGVNNILFNTRGYPTFLYANKGVDNLVQIKHGANSVKDEKQAFIDLIADNPKLLEEFKKNTFHFYYILKYVKAYNAEYLENNKNTGTSLDGPGKPKDPD